MAKKKYIVELSADERKYLQNIIHQGKSAARKIQHAHILLKADSGPYGCCWTDEEIAQVFSVNYHTIKRIRKRLVEHGLEDALIRRRRAAGPRKLKIDGETEAHLIALACCDPPAGYCRWTIRLLAEKIVELKFIDSVGRETVRTTLKKTN